MSDSLPEVALATFGRALDRLGDALAQPKTEWTRDAAIQRFEFSFELGWKTVARFALREGLECPSPRQAFRAAFRLGWIEDELVWLGMIEDRNLTAHTYREETAEMIYARLPKHHSALGALRGKLQG